MMNKKSSFFLFVAIMPAICFAQPVVYVNKFAEPAKYVAQYVTLIRNKASLNSDLRNVPAETLKLLLNKDLIAVNQDRLGKQAVTIYQKENLQVLQKELSNADIALCIFNRSAEARTGTVNLKKALNTGILSLR